LAEIAKIGRNEKYSQFQIAGWGKVLDTIRQRKGLVIVAPTGAGKSEVFMLPLIFEISRSIIAGNSSVDDPRFVFIYPRVELLKDQLERIFKYVYWAQKTIPRRPRATKSNAPRKHNRIIIGFQFGGIGRDNKATLDEPSIFRDKYFEIVKQCPVCKRGRLVAGNKWYGVTPLRCDAPDCDAEFSTTISRECHTEAHPHILVTTEESLNRLYLIPRRKYEEYLQSISGVVYDEAHLHYSLKGAHLYHLIDNIEKLKKGGDKRPRLARIASSATITHPGTFAAKLFDGDDSRPVPVHDAEDFETEPSGLELIYFLQSPSADGSPQPNSTMIQSVMGLGHGLFSEQSPERQERAILFTESVDITKRFRAQISDAERNTRLWEFRTDLDSLLYEGQGCPGTDPARCSALYLKGECWRGIVGGGNCTSRSLPLRLHPLTINMVSSQTRADYWDGEVVVATSSLEVGVDDPRIKSTFHYLPPRTVFSFIQRRGRAGRSRDAVAYSVMVLGNDASSQFYLYRRNRLLSSKFYELPLNAKNPIVAAMHETLVKERARMGASIKRYATNLKSGAQEGILEWVFETLTRCSVINSLYRRKLEAIRSFGRPESQQRGLVQWIEEETRRVESFLNVQWTLEEIEDESPSAERTDTQEIKRLVELFLNGDYTLEPEIQGKVQLLVDKLSALIIPESDSEVRDRLRALRLKLEQVWEAIRYRREKGYAPDLTLALYDFFRTLGSRFDASKHWLFNYEPDVIKTLLQAFFYLGLATLKESDHRDCPSCLEHFVPDAFFQQVKPLVVELRTPNPRDEASLAQESISDLASMFFPYKTIYRYFGEHDLTVVETDLVGDRARVVQGVPEVTIRLRGDGIKSSSLFVPQRIFVRPVRSNEEGDGIVKICQVCFKIYGVNHTGKCHNSDLMTVKLFATPIVERTGRPFPKVAPQPFSRTLEFMELEGYTKVLGAEVTATKIIWKNGRYTWTKIKVPFRAMYEPPVAYRIPTRGIRWNLGSIISLLKDDEELRQQLAERGKTLTPEIVLHTGVHMLYKAISSISGVNQDVLEYAVDEGQGQVMVWERYDGGAGISELIRESVRTDPRELYRELLASAVCPINLEEDRSWTDTEELTRRLSDRWFLSEEDPFLSLVVSEATAERQSGLQGERITEGHISCQDGCAVCVQVTYCNAGRDEQPNVTSRLVAEAILRYLIRHVTTAEWNKLVEESQGRNVTSSALLQSAPDKEESDVLLL
jgi:superfamily II DNA or RNA helicase